MNTRVDVALIHWPVFDRAKNVVCTNVTNFDIHDIARASRTYGVTKYFIVNRLKEQLSFVARVLEHWRLGIGAEYNPSRKTALSMVELAETLEDVLKTYEVKPLVVMTSARELGIPRVTFKELRQNIFEGDGKRPILLVFGTGFGLTLDVLNQADVLLEPIKAAAKDEFRHLSVRSAVSIVLDRLLGAW
ncbi:MAG TPA: RNA methyltransferase [Bdellovibrionales bacterium]|nr:RNA methyltransferase [Bdellovibrionales bacterium]